MGLPPKARRLVAKQGGVSRVFPTFGTLQLGTNNSNTLSSWGELIAAGGAGQWLTGLTTYASNTGSVTYALHIDIGFGAAGSEVVAGQVAVILAAPGPVYTPFAVPIFRPPSTRVAGRVVNNAAVFLTASFVFHYIDAADVER